MDAMGGTAIAANSGDLSKPRRFPLDRQLSRTDVAIFGLDNSMHAIQPLRRPRRQRSAGSSNPKQNNNDSSISGGDVSFSDDQMTMDAGPTPLPEPKKFVAAVPRFEDLTLSPEFTTAPCSSIYCGTYPTTMSSKNEIQRANNTDSNRLSSSSTSPPMLTMNEERIRAFLHDYHTDYGALKDMQSLDTWSCFAEQYYDPEKFIYIRPSGNPIGYEELVKGLTSDMRILSIQLVSIDSITILSSNMAAVVVYTCDHSFEFKGILSEERGVMTSILEIDQTKGAIKIVHEHRSSGRPIPKETRWQAASYVPDKER